MTIIITTKSICVEILFINESILFTNNISMPGSRLIIPRVLMKQF